MFNFKPRLARWRSIANYLIPTERFNGFISFLRLCFFEVLGVGPMPRHIAFILDGNRRYGKKWNLNEGEGHHIGFINLMSILRYCSEMGVEFVTVYAFSIDNFKRRPLEVKLLMDLIREKTEALMRDVDVVNQVGVRINFFGCLDLLDEPIREAAKTLMAATAGNTKLALLVCVAYTSTDEIVRGVEGACKEEWERCREEGSARGGSITATMVEKKMYFSGIPDPDILIRTSGEKRLSNFVLWQTKFCFLYSPRCLWPEISLRHLVWAVLLYQRNHAYLEKLKKQG